MQRQLHGTRTPARMHTMFGTKRSQCFQFPGVSNSLEEGCHGATFNRCSRSQEADRSPSTRVLPTLWPPRSTPIPRHRLCARPSVPCKRAWSGEATTLSLCLRLPFLALLASAWCSKASASKDCSLHDVSLGHLRAVSVCQRFSAFCR